MRLWDLFKECKAMRVRAVKSGSYCMFIFLYMCRSDDKMKIDDWVSNLLWIICNYNRLVLLTQQYYLYYKFKIEVIITQLQLWKNR